MPKKNQPSEDDVALFRRSVGPVRKVVHTRVQHAGKAPPPRPRRQSDLADTVVDRFSDADQHDSVQAADLLFFARPGVQQRQLKKLRRGQLQVNAELDMHGMTASQARQELARFIDDCCEHNLRCVHIIHGKGYGTSGSTPVLKNRVNHWLRQHPDVLAFSSGQPKHGGSGAVLVLLKSRR